MKETEVLKAVLSRFACKKYLPKEIAKEDLLLIAEAARLSPSSFGLEPFDMHIARSLDIIEACFMQECMKTAPVTFVLTVKKAKFYDPESEWIRERAERFPGGYEEFVKEYAGYWRYLKSQGTLDSWSRSQSYIAAANAMTAAAEIGIESCAIEGYDNDRLIQALGLDGNDEEIGIAVAFGYPDESRERIRRPLDECIKWHFQ